MFPNLNLIAKLAAGEKKAFPLSRVDKRTFFCQLGTCSHLEINPLTSKEEGAFFLRNEPTHKSGTT